MSVIRLLLVSQSPRRRELVTWLGLSVRTAQSGVDERTTRAETPADIAPRLALSKARAIKETQDGEWILAADTVVDLDHMLMGKPETPDEARTMLRQLRKSPHSVHTGVILYNPFNRNAAIRRVTTEVWMRRYTEDEIEAYVASNDPMDKAGAYAIQHAGFHPVAHLNRCYANVVGLPLCAVAALLQEWGCALTVNIPLLCYTHFGYQCPAPDKGVRL